MSGTPITLGPFVKGLHNSAGNGEYIDDKELFELVNLEVDTDGSLANRPAIATFVLPAGLGSSFKVIGVYQPSGGAQYLVVSYVSGSSYGVALVNVGNNTLAASKTGFTGYCVAGVQYNEKYYVFPAPGTSDVGGYFTATPSWVTKALPGGQASACVMYKERLFSVAGFDSTANTSRMSFSNISDPTSLTGTNWFDFEPGNGQKITDLVVLNNDLVVFKEHSTFRAGYTSDVAKMEISTISTTIGTPKERCVVVYDSNSIYIGHDNSVYELYNYSFTKISSGLDMSRGSVIGLRSDSLVGLTLFRNRLFARYYNHLYVYSLLSNRWSEWETTKQFSSLVVLPDTSGDIAFTASIVTADAGSIYKFIDDRLEGIQTDEDYECRITTKTYDFDLSYQFKVLFWWGMTLATTGLTTATVSVPNAKMGPTWQYMKDTYTWDAAKNAPIPWSTTSKVIFSTVVAATGGGYSRKFLRFPKKLRFRQASFQIVTDVRPNTLGDAAVRIYDLAVFLKPKQIVPNETTA